MFERFTKETTPLPALAPVPTPAEPSSTSPRRTGMDVMASGFVHLTAEERTDRDGRPYTRAVMAVTRDGLPPLHVRLVSHVPKVSFSLQAMEPGEALSVSGNLLLTDTGSVVINARRLLTATPNTRHNPNKRNAA